MREPGSLYVRTSLTIFIALFIFLAFAAVVVFLNIMQPIARQSAADMAALMVLSAQTWVELSPEARPRFEIELNDYHQIFITQQKKTLQAVSFNHPYLIFLQEALEKRLQHPVKFSKEVIGEQNIWLDISLSKHIIHIGFPYQHIGANPPMVVFLLLIGAAVLIFLTSSLLVKRLTTPLEKLSQATLQMGRGKKVPPLVESGAKELTLLTRSFNQMNHRVQQLLDNRTTLLAGISHDLRTPISRIHIALELMGNKCDPELTDSIRSDLNEMNNLIAQTQELALSREKATAKLETVNLNELISLEVLKFKQEFELIEWQPTSSCNALISKTALQRVLQNLLQNAIRYGEDQPIVISLMREAEEFIICIADQGPGIPQAHRSDIFQPFFRLEASRNINTGGSGLGLAIVSQLCEIYGWSIELKTNEMKGSIFCLRIKSALLV